MIPCCHVVPLKGFKRGYRRVARAPIRRSYAGSVANVSFGTIRKPESWYRALPCSIDVGPSGLPVTVPGPKFSSE